MRFAKNAVCLCLLLVLPIGYYSDEPDTSSVWFRLGGGTGRYSTVIESCDAPPMQYTDNYADIGAEIAIRPSVKDPFILGLRGGHLSAGTIPRYGNSVENGYLNPYVSLEFSKFGAGIGWVRNLGPVLGDAYWDEFWWDLLGHVHDIDPTLDFRRSKDFPSMHIRIGSYSSLYFITSLCEGVPIVSQYGNFLMGLGYGGVEGWHFTSGVSAGFYDGGGLYVGIGRDLRRYGRPELSFRVGSSEDEFEGGISLGWTIPIN